MLGHVFFFVSAALTLVGSLLCEICPAITIVVAFLLLSQQDACLCDPATIWPCLCDAAIIWAALRDPSSVFCLCTRWWWICLLLWIRHAETEEEEEEEEEEEMEVWKLLPWGLCLLHPKRINRTKKNFDALRRWSDIKKNKQSKWGIPISSWRKPTGSQKQNTHNNSNKHRKPTNNNSTKKLQRSANF